MLPLGFPSQSLLDLLGERVGEEQGGEALERAAGGGQVPDQAPPDRGDGSKVAAVCNLQPQDLTPSTRKT